MKTVDQVGQLHFYTSQHVDFPHFFVSHSQWDTGFLKMKKWDTSERHIRIINGDIFLVFRLFFLFRSHDFTLNADGNAPGASVRQRLPDRQPPLIASPVVLPHQKIVKLCPVQERFP